MTATTMDEVANGAPWQHWGTVQNYINHSWDPENCPHHLIIGLTGSGKTYLALNGILKPLCAMDRVLILDTKGDDKTIGALGRPVEKLPRDTWSAPGGFGTRREPKPFDHWFRLIVSDDPAKGREQLYSTLDRVYTEGDWVLFSDEAYDLTGRESPYYHRAIVGQVQRIQRKGRGHRVSMITATQEPVNILRTFFSQASFAWMGRIRDEERQKRLLQIGGLTRHELPLVSSLQRRQWLLAADNGEYFARSVVS